MAFNPFGPFPPQGGTPGGSARFGDLSGGQDAALLRQRQERAQGSFQQMLEAITRMLSGGGPGGLPGRENLLNPRLADITNMFGSARNKLLNQFASMGRDVTGSVPQERLTELGSREAVERQRAMGEVDTLLAELGLRQQSLLPQMIAALSQMFKF